MPQGMTHIPGIYNYSNQQLDSDNSFGMKMDTKHYTLNGLVDSDGNVQDPTTSLNNTIYDNFFYFIDGN
ncbi:hypothetical protein FACS189459_2160 [Bacilli bacterium]|nr:hypothetical protein FACS189459_2160 [Bacilli bacterium]